MKDVLLLNEMAKMSKRGKTKQASKTPHFKWPQPSTTQTKQVRWAKSAEIPFYKRLRGLWTLKKEVSRKRSRTGVKLRQTCFLILLLLFLIIGSWWQGSWCGASLIINIFTILHACKVESTNTRVKPTGKMRNKIWHCIKSEKELWHSKEHPSMHINISKFIIKTGTIRKSLQSSLVKAALIWTDLSMKKVPCITLIIFRKQQWCSLKILLGSIYVYLL